MEELRNTLALIAIKGVGSTIARHLIDAFGSAEEVFEADNGTLMSIPRIGQVLIEAKQRKQQLLDNAEKEIRFVEEHHINALCLGHPDYPQRLKECPDAPVVLIELGKHVTESKHVLSIVGTRLCTQYGRDMTRQLVQEMKDLVPDLVVVSGLALGIDISAHRAALEFGFPTIAVVAHGLDRIYPYQHRDDARKIIAEGGAIMTEYFSGVGPDRPHFLARNRIVAGLADAVLVSESKDRGGSLVTASIALDYNRDVFAFPGRTHDDRSMGCNRLIRLNRAGLVTSARDLAEAMGWINASSTHAIQQTLNFGEDGVSDIGHRLLDALRDRGDLRLSQLCDLLPMIDRYEINEALLDLEMDGKIRNTPGGLYQLR